MGDADVDGVDAVKIELLGALVDLLLEQGHLAGVLHQLSEIHIYMYNVYNLTIDTGNVKEYASDQSRILVSDLS